jgi:signal transduction histidine kinase
MDRLLTRQIVKGIDRVWKPRIGWLVPVVYLGCIVAFVADLTVDVFDLPFGILYIPLVCTALFFGDPRWVWRLAGLASVMAIVGHYLPEAPSNVGRAVTIRVLSVAAIWTTAILVRYARGIQDELKQQTARAEAAERIKTEVFTTLSKEMRSPLHTMVGLSAVMIAGCRPDQRMPLQHVQSGSKRLLATIENLIDLTHLDERPIATETVDVSGMIRQAEASNRQMAAERQITVALDLPSAALTARADAWAVQRILDNLIANALKFSHAGGTVELAAEQRAGAIALVVRDAGMGMSDEILRRLGEPYCQELTGVRTAGTGTGLALSRRLARAMGAELAFNSEIGCGTTAILRLPA